jgi:hypothetical protein
LRWLLASLVVLTVGLGCGGGGPPPEEEVTATWTAGDDEPLEDESGVEEE